MRLPGEEIIQKGMLDLSENRITKEALLVSIGEPRLNRLGYVIPPCNTPATPEHTLFKLCVQEDPQHAHRAYNALIRRLTSFEHAATRAIKR